MCLKQSEAPEDFSFRRTHIPIDRDRKFILELLVASGNTYNKVWVSEMTNLFKMTDDKLQRIQNAPIGTIVAVKLDDSSVKSAKIVRRSSDEKLLKVTTEYGASYIVKYESVVWVKSGSRWPRWVYNLLKGIEEFDEVSA